MVDFRHMRGFVYILENSKANRVKVGMTINNVNDRLGDVNDMWLERKVTCQICGSHVVNSNGRVPRHVVSGQNCQGGNVLPLEKDTSLAESHLESMKIRHNELSGSEKGSITKMIKTIEKRIELFQNREYPVGLWQLSTTFYTDCAEKVELLSHEILGDNLDTTVSFGEVFSCSVQQATEAVENALNQLGLLQTSKKEIKIKEHVTSKKNGTCVICDNYLTTAGACPECVERFSANN
ncbi:MAG: hypothetical protein V3V22_02090 [Methylococcales bacterium]